jgi:uncharacterized protein DUF4124
MLRKLLLTALLAFPLAAGAQMYRCVGKDGKKYYGQNVPPQCLGQPVEQLNAQGMVTKRFDAAATAADREKKEAEEAERKKREAISKEEGRRNRALLATYTSEKDIDDARARALKENEAAMKDIERKIALLKQDRAKAAKDLKELDPKKTTPGEKTQAEQRVTNYDFDIKTQQELLAAKQKEVNVINARYDEDKKRYGDLTKTSK